MASNYQVIREENIRWGGEGFDDMGKFISDQLYSDQTHFIFELLQNAEDALARRYKYNPSSPLPKSVTFHLFKNRLEVRHFGQPFNEDDVRGISNVLRSSKNNDDTQIGRFGIGFKSVYAFTSSPEIHSGDEHFRIERYIRPFPVEERKLDEGETLFIFPFNLPKSAQDTFQRISCRLNELRPRILLFLRHINEIQWNIVGNVSRTYRCKSQQVTLNCRKVTVTGQNQENWLIFKKQIEETSSLEVEVAFQLVKDHQTGKDQIKPLGDEETFRSPLVVFLPTEIETNLKFLVQGPYKTTPARDNIVRDDDFNISLIERTAELVSESILTLRNDSNLAAMDLLTINFFNSLPIRAADFPKESLFYPIFEQVRQTFKQHKLLPTTQQGEYISATQAKLARSSDLRNLISETELHKLYGNGFRWLSEEITQSGKKTAEFYSYLQGSLEIEEIEPEDFARKLSLSFLEEQSDGWMAKFYAFLEGQRALWREGGVLRNKPFIRLQDNRHVVPFRDKTSPSAYLPLPSDQDTKFPAVKREITENKMFGKAASGFLRNLGFSEPDAFAEVMENIIPKYEQKLISVKTDEHLQDLHKIIRAINSVILSTSARVKKEDLELRKNQLLNKLETLPFLRAVNAAYPDRKTYKRPGELYLASADLENYFKGNQSVWFLEEKLDEREQAYLLDLGVRRTVKVTRGKPGTDGHIIISSYHREHKRGLNGFDPNCQIDGLEHALKHPTPWKAVYIWNNLVCPNVQHIYGKVEFATRKDFSNSQSLIKQASRMGQLLRDRPWIPDKQGNFKKPSDLSLDDLPDDFVENATIAERLGIQPSANFNFLFTKVPPKYRKNLTPERLGFITQHPDKVDQLIQEEMSKRSQQNDSDEEDFDTSDSTASDIDYASAFQAAFDRPGKTELLKIEEPGSVGNPKQRLENLKRQIIQDKSNEASKFERFKKVQVKRWEGKNTDEVRGFLKETYGGQCQICHGTFPKHDGNPYFEGVYIVSYTGARWIDRPGNVLCLCPNCSAKFQHGSVEVQENVLEQIQKYQARNEDGSLDYRVSIELCGEKCQIRFHQKHMLEIQSLLDTASS